MAKKKTFRIKDKQGNEVDYGIPASRVMVDADTELDDVLSDIEESVEETDASAVKKITYNGEPKTPDQQGNISINQEQPNWNESNTQHPSYVKNKPSSVVNEISYDPQSRKVRQKRNEVFEDVFTLPEGGSTTVPDNEMSDQSENVVQNKVIKAFVETFVSQAISNLINGAPAALDTLKELADKLGDNDDAIAALTNLIGTKANSNAVIKSISVNGQTQSKDTNGNVNVVVPDTSTLATKQEMADAIDDALGEAQVTVVPANSVGIISSLGSDSDEDALSASMGKKLKVAVLTILNALGTYAFPEGKPVIDWGDDSPVTYTVQKTIGIGLSATGGDTDVALGDSLEVSIAITNNLYIVDDDSVVVTMGGSPVQGAWNASTMKVTIAAVTGDVVINVPSMTYVGYGEQNSPLVLMFDGKNQGSTANQWKNLCNDNKPLVLSGGYTKNQDGITFNGTDGTGKIESLGVDLPWNSSAMEAVFTQTNTTPTQVIALCGNQYNSVLAEGAGSGGVIYSNNGTVPDGGSALSGAYFNYLTKNGTMPYNTNTVVHLVNNGGNDHYLNNVALEKGSVGTGNSMYVGISTSQHNNAGEFWVSGFIARNNTFLGALKGTLYAVRAYNRVLTTAELAQNHKVDKKRFNIA